MQVVPSIDGSSSQSLSGRNHGLDILRATLTAFVILHHTAIVYGGDGSWYFIDKASHRPLTTLLLSFFCALNQSFFMGLFFLLAGYFTPPTIARQGFATYAQDRLLRLGLPILVYGFLIGPLTLALARTGQGAEFLPTFTALLAQARFEIGPLWFLEALLLFAALYGLIWRWAWLPAWHGERSLRSTNLLLSAIAVGLCAFLLRLIWPVGQTVLACNWAISPPISCSSSSGVVLRKGRGSPRSHRPPAACGPALRFSRCLSCPWPFSSAPIFPCLRAIRVAASRFRP